MSSEGLELALQDMLVGKCFVGPLCLEPFEVPNSLESKNCRYLPKMLIYPTLHRGSENLWTPS